VFAEGDIVGLLMDSGKQLTLCWKGGSRDVKQYSNERENSYYILRGREGIFQNNLGVY
jgi:hypothetical protein